MHKFEIIWINHLKSIEQMGCLHMCIWFHCDSMMQTFVNVIDNNLLIFAGDEKLSSTVLLIESMDRHKGGTYICTANNGVGQPASTQVVLHVLCKYHHSLLTSSRNVSCTAEAIWCFRRSIILQGMHDAVIRVKLHLYSWNIIPDHIDVFLFSVFICLYVLR